MNKTQKILLISFSAPLALLLVALFVAAGVSVAKNGMQGLVGELFEDAVKKVPETMPQEQMTLNEPDKLMDILFDLDQTHMPSYEDYLKIEEDMTIVEIVEIMGKPHSIEYATGKAYFYWEMADGGFCNILSNYRHEDRDLLMSEGYGGSIAFDINYFGPSNEDGK
jgi:hypothetical protein